MGQDAHLHTNYWKKVPGSLFTKKCNTAASTAMPMVTPCSRLHYRPTSLPRNESKSGDHRVIIEWSPFIWYHCLSFPWPSKLLNYCFTMHSNTLGYQKVSWIAREHNLRPMSGRAVTLQAAAISQATSPVERQPAWGPDMDPFTRWQSHGHNQCRRTTPGSNAL